MAASLPLLSSSTRARAREEGGGSGPNPLGGEELGDKVVEEDVGEGWSGELGGLGRMIVFLSKKEGWVKRPSKG